MDKDKLMEEYKVAKMNVQMIDAYLESVNIVKGKDSLKGEYINEINFQKKVEKDEEDRLKGYLKTNVLCKNADTEDVDVQISVIYSGIFYSNENIDESQLEMWVDAQLVPQLLSYSRSLITVLTAHMNIPPIFLPTMDVLESIKINDYPESQDGE